MKPMKQRCENILWIVVYGNDKEKSEFRNYMDPQNESSEARFPYTHIMMRVDSATNQLIPLTKDKAEKYRYSHIYSSLKNADFVICFESSVNPKERMICKALTSQGEGIYISYNPSSMTFEDCRNKIMVSLNIPTIPTVKEKCKLLFFANTQKDSQFSTLPTDIISVISKNIAEVTFKDKPSMLDDFYSSDNKGFK